MLPRVTTNFSRIAQSTVRKCSTNPAGKTITVPSIPIPQVAFVVACAAFCFQATVLHPYHHHLSEHWEKIQAAAAVSKEECFRRKELVTQAKEEGLERTALAEKLNRKLVQIDAKLTKVMRRKGLIETKKNIAAASLPAAVDTA